jgi:leader peptidase (prepilin peptidase)/N-methyltransferase
VTTALAVVLAAVVAGVGGLLVPRLVRSLPEPPPPDEPYPGEPPKPLYADLAARRGVAWWASALSAALAAGTAWSLGPDPWLVALVPLVPVGVTLAWVDLHTRLLPSRIVLPATAYAVVVALVLWAVSGDHDDVLRAAVGLVVLRSVYWLLWRIHSAGMGFGDVRLAALVGFALGHVGAAELLVGGYAAFLVFGLPGLILALVRWDRSLLRTPFPFGPAMLAGALLGLWWGASLLGRLVGA